MDAEVTNKGEIVRKGKQRMRNQNHRGNPIESSRTDDKNMKVDRRGKLGKVLF